MSKVEELEKRIVALESAMEAVIAVSNKILDDFYEPEFVHKLDKLAEYGEAHKDGE